MSRFEHEMSATVTEPQTAPRAIPRQRPTIQELAKLHRRDSALGVIYYVQRGDGSIKVGTTSSLSSRLRHLRSAHGAVTLLATERGSFSKEDKRHRQFAADALGHEWFRPSAELLAHIETLAGAR